ncbi:hypothetical protein EI94DRAFT_1727655 [Lactarius quietus]|nr:hypothetical protein EI94DRAFT_1727655 [Lactarius quietus]
MGLGFRSKLLIPGATHSLFLVSLHHEGLSRRLNISTAKSSSRIYALVQALVASGHQQNCTCLMLSYCISLDFA